MEDQFDYYSLQMYVRNPETHIIEEESLKNLSLSDFEVIYGNETREIAGIILLKQKGRK